MLQAHTHMWNTVNSYPGSKEEVEGCVCVCVHVFSDPFLWAWISEWIHLLFFLTFEKENSQTGTTMWFVSFYILLKWRTNVLMCFFLVCSHILSGEWSWAGPLYVLDSPIEKFNSLSLSNPSPSSTSFLPSLCFYFSCHPTWALIGQRSSCCWDF